MRFSRRSFLRLKRHKSTRALKKLLEESITLDQRFMKSSTQVFYYKAIAEEAEAHTKKLRKLYDRLTRAGRRPRETVKTTAHHKRKLRWPGTVNGALEKPPLEPSPAAAAE